MKDTLTYLYNYLDAKTVKRIHPTSINADQVDMVIKNSLYTLRVAKVVDHSYQDNQDKFIITTYFFESETV